ncbi:MAG: rRNA maturation RNase YbeY [Candidatus Zixiibacteriota bacterium]
MQLRMYREARTRLPGKKIRELFELVVAGEAAHDWRADINLVFTTDQKIRALNRTYRRMDKPTDVLSFNLDQPTRESAVFGEIYISVPTARRQAESAARPLVDEFLWLVCHGLLHLFGYNHKKPSEAARMKAREALYLAEVCGR